MAKISDAYLIDLLKSVAGPDVISLVNVIKDKENVSEFKIADKLKLTVNQVRNMLYRLSEHNLVNSTRNKDKKKGWYIYYWTFDHRRAILLLRKIKQDRLEALKKQLKTLQEISFFVCKDCKLRYTYENALEMGFLCSNCALPLQSEDPAAGTRLINKEMAKLEADLASVDLKEPEIIVEEEPVKKKLKKKIVKIITRKQKKPVKKHFKKKQIKPAKKKKYHPSPAKKKHTSFVKKFFRRKR